MLEPLISSSYAKKAKVKKGESEELAHINPIVLLALVITVEHTDKIMCPQRKIISRMLRVKISCVPI